MKRMARIAVMLLVVMIGAALVSCAGQIVETKVTLKITAGSDQIFSGEITVTNESPTVLQIVKEAELLYPGAFTVKYDEDDTQVEKINQYYNTEIDGKIYLWEYKINGEFPETGKASTNTVANGDVIEYVFDVGTPTGNNKFVYEPYDSSLGLFPEDEATSSEETESGDATA